MATKKHFLIFLSVVSLITLCSQEPQLSYWQQFKNWISGTSSYAQSMAEVPYEWAQNFVAGLTKGQKAAILVALGTSAGHLLRQQSKTGTVTPLGFTESVVSGAVVGLSLKELTPLIEKYFNAASLQIATKQIEQDLKNSEKFPTWQSRIEGLEIMKAAYAPNGEKSNPIAYQAVSQILEEYKMIKRELQELGVYGLQE